MIINTSRNDVDKFLRKIKEILLDKQFNVDTDFALIKSKKVDEEYSTPYTLLDLDYDVYDVIDHLIKLDVSDFSEVKLDEDDPNPPLLYVFGTEINGREVYIKIKYRGFDDSNQVICVSFHYSKWSMDYPFKEKRG